ncbi:MAG: peptidyl-prolyl cis-trans isomerase [Planctomycetota bacterium]
MSRTTAFFPGLFLITLALVAAVSMRPTVGEELMGLVGARADQGSPRYEAAGGASQSAVLRGQSPYAPTERVAAAPSVPWPANPAGEAFAGDTPIPAMSGLSPLPSYPPVPQQGYPVAGSRPIPAYPNQSAPSPAPSYDEARSHYGQAPRYEQPSPPPVLPPPYVAQPAYPPNTAPLIAPPHQNAAVPPAIAPAKRCEGARPLAWVGSDVILAGEVMPGVDEIVARIPEKELAAIPERELEIQKKALTRKLLDNQIETKLIYQDAQRTIPAEKLPEIEKRIGEHFEEKELPTRIEEAKVTSRRELDEKLRSMGTSLERTKRVYVERTLAMQWMHQQNDSDPHISHLEMLDYYHEHLPDFETPARARWERMSVGIPRYTDGSEARAKLARIGNRVIQGASMADAVKAEPERALECEGGLQGWVTEGALEVSRTLEESIFNLPVGRPSSIFREGDSFCIVRVLEREETKRTPFEEAQVEIRRKIKDLQRKEQIQAYLARLKEQIPVRTVFDNDPDLARLSRPSDPSMH